MNAADMNRLRRARAASRAAIQRRNDIRRQSSYNTRPEMIGGKSFGMEAYGGDPMETPRPGLYQRQGDYNARYRGMTSGALSQMPAQTHLGPYTNYGL